eukprot:240134_1
MSENEPSKKWINLTQYPVIDSLYSSLDIPTGIEANNYVVIDHNRLPFKINSIHKYNIEHDKWIKMDNFNNAETICEFSAVLDVKKQILFLLREDCLTEIQLNNNNIRNDNENVKLNHVLTLTSIIINDSLFVIG